MVVGAAYSALAKGEPPVKANPAAPPAVRPAVRPTMARVLFISCTPGVKVSGVYRSELIFDTGGETVARAL